MPTYHCTRCGKGLSGDQMFQKKTTTQSSGTFVVGHVSDNPDLPMIGVPLNSQSSLLTLCCKTCGEEVWETPTEDEKEEKREAEQINYEKSIAMWVWVIACGIIFIILVLMCLH